MRHEMLTQHAPFVLAKKGTLSQHFVTHVVPCSLAWPTPYPKSAGLGKGSATPD